MAALRSALTVSRSAKPDRSASIGTGATAALPSSEAVAGGPAGVPAAASTRWRAASTAVTSAGDNVAPSVREATRITGALSPPGKSLANNEARADSADAGMGIGEDGRRHSAPLHLSARRRPPEGGQ